MALAGPDPPGRHDTVHGAEGPVDLAVALRWLGGDQALLRELVGIFVDDGRAMNVSALARIFRAVLLSFGV